MMKRAFLILTTSLFLSASAIAAGSGGSDNSGGGGTADTMCYNGKVYDKKKKMCVKPQASLDDGSLVDHAYQLALKGKAHEALTFLARVSDRNDPYFLNIQGFATRKVGDVDRGIAFYKQALAIDTNNVLVRNYLGEAYVTKGDFELARAELSAIYRICGGTECKEYRDLANVISNAGGVI